MYVMIQMRLALDAYMSCIRNQNMSAEENKQAPCAVPNCLSRTVSTIERIAALEQCRKYFKQYLLRMEHVFRMEKYLRSQHRRNYSNEEKARIAYEHIGYWLENRRQWQEMFKQTSQKDCRGNVQLNNKKMKMMVDVMYRIVKRIKHLNDLNNVFRKTLRTDDTYECYVDFMDACRNFFAMTHPLNETVLGSVSLLERHKIKKLIKGMRRLLRKYEHILSDTQMIFSRYCIVKSQTRSTMLKKE